MKTAMSLVFLVIFIATSALGAPRGYAVVVGNNAYPVKPLAHAVDDATAIADALTGLGYNTRPQTNASLKEMQDSIATIRTHDSEAVIVYFAGHGLQVNGENYLLPVDAKINEPTDVPANAIALSNIFEALGEDRSQPAIVILDACRNNPYATLDRAGDWVAGLAPPQGAPANTLVAYATNPGNIASDGVGRHSLYTRALLRYIGDPGQTLEDFFKLVRSDVQANTDGFQIPWETSSLKTVYAFRDPLYLWGQITAADDDALVLCNGSEALDWNNDGNVRKKLPLHAGTNELIVKVYNQRSYTGGIQYLGGHLPEGWYYTLELQDQSGAPLKHLHAAEDLPEDNGPRHGKLFTVARLSVIVDRATGQISITDDYELHP